MNDRDRLRYEMQVRSAHFGANELDLRLTDPGELTHSY